MRYINCSVEEAYDFEEYKFYGSYSKLSEKEKSMTFNLDYYNVYLMDIKFDNKSGMDISFIIDNFCIEDMYMFIPESFSYNMLVSGFDRTNSYYIFVNKEINSYFRENTIDFNAEFQRVFSFGEFKINAGM